MSGSAEKHNNIIPLNTKVKETRRGNTDFALLFTILVLLVIGLTMMFSASSAANMTTGNVFTPIIKQAILGVVGVLFMLAISLSDYKALEKWSGLMYLLVQLLMFAVPIVGIASHGAVRQINLGLFSFQPSEFSKYFMIIMLAAQFASHKNEKVDNWSELITCIMVICIPIAACFLQKHGSAALIHIAVGVTMMIVSGIDIKKLGPKKVAGIAAVLLALITVVFITTGGYRIQRIITFISQILGEEIDSQGTGWQSKQSVYAVGSGGLFGLGIGNSRQKYSYLPEAENDYIFAIVAEELGFIGSLIVILLFCVLVWRGIMIAINCKDRFGSYLAFGISALIGFQTLINMCVVLQLLPSTGMQLPLFSSGGTSLLITLMGFGILLSISRYTKLN